MSSEDAVAAAKPPKPTDSPLAEAPPVYVFARLRRPALRIAAALVVLYALYRAVGAFVSIDSQLLWFRSVQHESVYTRTFWSQAAMFAIFGGVMLLVVSVNIALAYRYRPAFVPDPAKQRWRWRYHHTLHPARRWVFAVAVLWLTVSIGSRAAGKWQYWLEWRNAVPFGIKDPQFHRDISYFIDIYPMHRLTLTLGFAILVRALIAVLIVGYLYGALRFRGARPRTTTALRVQVAILVGLYLVLKAGAYWLDRMARATSNLGVVTGPGYTDVHALLPAKIVLLFVALVSAAAVFAGAATRRNRFAVGGVVAMCVCALAFDIVLPTIVQQFRDKPSASSLEIPYVGRNLTATRNAFGLTGNVSVIHEPGEQTVSDATLRSDANSNVQVRLLDPNRVSPTFKQLQQPQRSYYTFKSTLDVDRYPIGPGGELQDVLIGVRELNQRGLPSSQQSWANRHLVYTHGNGVVAAPTDTVSNHTPKFVENNLPPSGALGPITTPQIYYGQMSPSYSIVGAPTGSTAKEFDRPSPDGSGQVDSTHAGGGGVPISSLLNRLVYAVKLHSLSLLFSNGINHDSQLLYVRNPRSRVAAVAPWLTLDGDVYPVISDGHILWVVDGYTTANNYPYSQQVNLKTATSTTLVSNGSTTAQNSTSVNYMRNSVKATVDAYSGKVTLYAWNQTPKPDPILQTWEKSFPGLVQPQRTIPASLLPHLRYPQDLFNVQRTLLAKYHVTSAQQFYSGSDFWKVPADPTTGSNGFSGTAIPSTYMTLSPTGTTPATFSLSTPMVTLNRRTLAAFMSVDSQPGPDYGHITVQEFPSNRTVDGPAQIRNDIETNTRIAQHLTLLRGGQVKVVLGNLLTVPLGGTVMYVEPIYTQATGGNTFPTLQKVIVLYSNHQPGYGSTLSAALDQSLNP